MSRTIRFSVSLFVRIILIASFSSVCIIGCQQNKSANNLEKNKEVIHRLYEETWNKGNLNMADECYPAKFMQH
ncbi:MAG: hypothetical protein JXB48_11765, partial [Candidatus Latescibacteria bacterium]|nr:hypothetical protein [Candidatus Latescibacterota bacterium]